MLRVRRERSWVRDLTVYSTRHAQVAYKNSDDDDDNAGDEEDEELEEGDDDDDGTLGFPWTRWELVVLIPSEDYLDYDSDFEVRGDSGKGVASADPYAGKSTSICVVLLPLTLSRYILLEG